MKYLKRIILLMFFFISLFGCKNIENSEENQLKLVEAVKIKDIKLVNELLDKGVDVNINKISNKKILYPITYSVSKTFNNFEITELLIKNGAKINETDRGLNCFTVALNNLDENILKLLLKNGANINILDINYGFTPLMNLCMFKKAKSEDVLRIAGFLVENGSNIDMQSKDGLTALIVATSEGNIEMVKFLLKNGANKDLKDKEGLKAIDYTDNEEIKELLK